jgi:hypothetical protein
MKKESGVQFAMICWALACFPATAAVGQPTERIGGSWFASEDKVGLVLRKGDFHPYFMHGECEKPHRRARLNLEIEPKLFGDAVAREEYIIVRWGNGSSNADSIVEGIFLNEAGRYVWSPFLAANLETVNFWLHASQLELTVGVREKDVFKARQTYILPDEDRQSALNSFIRFRFGDAIPPRR